MKKNKRIKKQKTTVGEAIFICFIVGLAIVMLALCIDGIKGAIKQSPGEKKIRDALESHKKAIQLCEGIDNVKQIDYKDGSTEFGCEDYSKIRKAYK